MEAKMALIGILKKYKFMRAPETEVRGSSIMTSTYNYVFYRYLCSWLRGSQLLLRMECISRLFLGMNLHLF